MIDLSHKKIIVTFLMHLGDLVLTTPFIHALRKAAPTAEITYLVDEKLKDVVLHNPYIDHVWTIDKKGRDNHLRALWAMGQKITDGHFDVLINLHPNERCSFIDAVARVPVKVGASHLLFRGFFDPYIKLNRTLHAADMYLDVLTRLGVTHLEHNGLEVFPGKADFHKAEAFWQEADLSPERGWWALTSEVLLKQNAGHRNALPLLPILLRKKAMKPSFWRSYGPGDGGGCHFQDENNAPCGHREVFYWRTGSCHEPLSAYYHQ